MPNYRLAKCIELHDSNLALTTEEECYAFTGPTGRFKQADKPAFRINLGDLCMVFTALGKTPFPEIHVPSDSDQTMAISGKSNKIENIEIPIYKAHFDYSDSCQEDKIIKLECCVETDRLAHIRVISVTDAGTRYVEEITYSGAFTVWWEPLAENAGA